MSMTAILVLTVCASAVTTFWAHLMGERFRVALAYGVLLGFVIPWGVGTLLWLAVGGLA